MAEKLGDAYVELGTRNAGLSAGLNKGLATVQKFAIAASAIFAGVAAGRGVAGLVGAYSDAVETTNKFNEVFNGASQDINKAADELGKSYGLIGTNSRKLLADTGDILVGFGFAEDAALDLAVQTNKLAVDLASFTNIEGGSARASQALTKALVGETEQAKALGIVIRQNSDEFKGIVKRLVETEGKTLLQAKALAALEIAVSQTKKAQGDYARTQDQLANQMRMTGERVQALKESTGGLFVQFLNAGDGVISFNNSLEKLADTLNSVTGAQIKTTKEVVLFTAATVGSYKALQLLIPALVKLAVNVSTMAAGGGIAAAIGSTAGLAVAAAGIAAIVVQVVKLRHATNQLLESQQSLNGTLDAMEKKYGTRSTARLRRMRREKLAAGLNADWSTPSSGGGAAVVAAKKEKSQSRGFSFGSFEDAIKTIQTSIGKDDETKKQTKILGSIDKGIQDIVKKPEMAVVGV